MKARVCGSDGRARADMYVVSILRQDCKGAVDVMPSRSPCLTTLSLARALHDAGPVQAWRPFGCNSTSYHWPAPTSSIPHHRTPYRPPRTRLLLTPAMSSIIARSAFRAAPRFQAAPGLRRWASAAAEGEREAGKQAIKTGAKKDPELYVCRRECIYDAGQS